MATNICATCHRAYYIRPCNIKRSNYCSRYCARGSNPLLLRNCIFCGSKYKPKNQTSKYCSRACHQLSRRIRIKKQCATCDQEFEVTPAKNATRHCSMKCRTQLDSNNPNYKNGHFSGRSNSYPYGGKWPTIRERAKKRDDHKCQWCSSTKSLEVHHIIPFKAFSTKQEANKQSNLITLCRKPCHQEAEYFDVASA
jgi:5-methylcytosine-specific restriction endonuclease McrA